MILFREGKGSGTIGFKNHWSGLFLANVIDFGDGFGDGVASDGRNIDPYFSGASPVKSYSDTESFCYALIQYW